MVVPKDTDVYLEAVETDPNENAKTNWTGSRQPLCATIANDRKGYWFNAGNKAVNWALNKERLIGWGYYDLATAYQSMHVNY